MTTQQPEYLRLITEAWKAAGYPGARQIARSTGNLVAFSTVHKVLHGAGTSLSTARLVHRALGGDPEEITRVWPDSGMVKAPRRTARAVVEDGVLLVKVGGTRYLYRLVRELAEDQDLAAALAADAAEAAPPPPPART